MPFKLNDNVSYLERTLGSNSYLKNNIKWTYKDDSVPVFKDYGIHIYLGLTEPKEIEYRKIGPWALEHWRINLDMVLNKNYKPRDSVSDSLGLSYWENYLTSQFFHKQNNGTFQDSWYETLGVDDFADSHIIRGIFHSQIDNQYTIG